MVEVAEEPFEPFILKAVVERRGEVEKGERPAAVYRKAHDAPCIAPLRREDDEHHEPRDGERCADAVSDAVEYFLGQGVLRMELHAARIAQNDPVFKFIVLS